MTRILRQGQSRAGFWPRLLGPQKRLEEGFYSMVVGRPTCSGNSGLSWRGRLQPDWECSLDLTPPGHRLVSKRVT